MRSRLRSARRGGSSRFGCGSIDAAVRSWGGFRSWGDFRQGRGLGFGTIVVGGREVGRWRRRNRFGLPINSDRFWGHLLQEPIAFRRPDHSKQRHPDKHPEEKEPPGIREPVRAQGREPRRKSWRSCGHPPPHFHPVLSRIFGMQEGSPGTAQSFPADPPAIRGRSPQCLVFKPQTESGRKDSNLRLPGPKPGALTRLSYAPSQGHFGRRPKSTRNRPKTSLGPVFWLSPPRHPVFRTARGSWASTPWRWRRRASR